MGALATNVYEAKVKELVARAILAAPEEGRRYVRAALAQACEVVCRTLRRWVAQVKVDKLPTMGRPRKQVSVEERNRAIGLLRHSELKISVEAVRKQCLNLPHRRIESMRKRLKRVDAKRLSRRSGKLTWYEPGRVWAMDFTQTKAEVEGGTHYLLHVRDLASGRSLAAAPAEGERTSTVNETLRTLFSTFGAPLVLKHDGGPGFIANETQGLLEAWGVASLRSPPRTPTYNGSCERSIGHLKGYIGDVAEMFGHPDRWTARTILMGLTRMNVYVYPWGENGPTPHRAFDERSPITEAERKAFKETLALEIERGMDALDAAPDTLPNKNELAKVNRAAIQETLIKLDYLTIERGR